MERLQMNDDLKIRLVGLDLSRDDEIANVRFSLNAISQDGDERHLTDICVEGNTPKLDMLVTEAKISCWRSS